ncbi:MAG: UTRA domain-containing protein [Oscillospiraceae bacterium]|nr:UTRA domain-containing protein [Oscillospiraceae bacterium]
MSTIPLLLQNDQIVYDVLTQLGVLAGAAFPSMEQLAWKTGLTFQALAHTLERLCQQRILQRGDGGGYCAAAKPLYLHYHRFRSFSQMLEYPDGSITVDLLSADPVEADSYSAEILRIPEKEKVIRIIRLYSRDGIPFAYEKYDVLYPLLKNTSKAEFYKSPVLHIIQNNLPLTAAPGAHSLIQSQYLSMVPSRDLDQRYLHLPLGANILRIIGRAYHEGVPVCSFFIRADATQCSFKYQSKLPL